MEVLIKFTTLGVDAGPFDLTTEVGVVNPNTATRSELLAGKIVTVNDSFFPVFITVTCDSTSKCNGSFTIEVIPLRTMNFGFLYNFFAVSDIKNIANIGWHVPTYAELQTLHAFLQPNAGGKIKEIGFSNWLSPNLGATNEYGFNAKGVGWRRDNGSDIIGGFEDQYQSWLAWVGDTSSFQAYTMYSSAAGIIASGFGPNFGFVVRLIKDDNVDPGTYTGNNGLVYPTIKIGDQVFISENLSETKYRDRSDIPNVSNNQEWIALTTGARCEIPRLSIKLTFNLLSNADLLIGGSSSDVSLWNTFFDLPVNGNPFTSVNIVGNEIELLGGSGITLRDSIFDDAGGYSVNLLHFVDAGCIVAANFDCFGDYNNMGCPNLITVMMPKLTSAGDRCFQDLYSLVSISLPSLITMGYTCFMGCSSLFTAVFNNLETMLGSAHFNSCSALTTLSIAKCTQLGDTVLDDNIFNGISGNEFTLVIPTALMTCNGGNPDGDIQYLQANNTVTLTLV
jgi:uncharacterized protein (TIGR02145 family)